MAIPKQLFLCMGIKVLVVLLTIAVLALLDPTYVTAYISINYEIVIIYIVSALTLLYCIASCVIYFLIGRSKGEGEEDYVPTNLAMTEVILCTAGIMGWLIIIGIGGTISQRTIIETGERFGWLAACAGIITGCFLGIAGMFILTIINDKILSRRPRYERGPTTNAYGGY